MSLQVAGISSHVASPELFGGNFLATVNEVESGGSHRLITELGVHGLRYPGGSVTEHYFDLSDPDAGVITTISGAQQDWTPLSDFMSFAADGNHPVTIVLPTRSSLGTSTDALGARWPDIDEIVLRQFLHDVVAGKYGTAQIEAFEIGNEYWGSGNMSSLEYGRLASDMTEIVASELSALSSLHPEAADIDIVVQAGTNHGWSNLSDEYILAEDANAILVDLEERYDLTFTADKFAPNGLVNWRLVNDEIIHSQFRESGTLEEVDGVVTHLYSQSQATPGSREFGLNQIEKTWGESDDELDYYITEWNTSAKSPHLNASEDYGLKQAHEMLNILEFMIDEGVDNAHVWALLHNTKTALSFGLEHEELSVPGEMFAIMQDTIEGKALLDFAPTQRHVTEKVTNTYDVHGFIDEGEVTLFIASTSDEQQQVNLELSALFKDLGEVSAQLLGVEEHHAPGQTQSNAYVETLQGSALINENGLATTLDPHEILAVCFSGFTPSDPLQSHMNAQFGQGVELPLPSVLPSSEEDEGLEEEAAETLAFDASGGGGGAGILGILALLFFL